MATSKMKMLDEKDLEKRIRTEFEKSRGEVIDACMEKLDINEDRRTMKIWPRKIDLDDLLEFKLGDLPMEFVVDRDPCTGAIQAYREVVKKDEHGTGRTSLSLTRAPGPPEEGIMGSTSKFPFFPGGMEEVFRQALKKQRDEFNNQANGIDFENDLLTIPPGFDRGVDFKSLRASKTPKASMESSPATPAFNFDENTDILSLMGMISGGAAQPFDFGDVKEPEKPIEKEATKASIEIDEEIVAGGVAVDEIVSKKKKPLGQMDQAKLYALLSGKTLEYAEVLDVNNPIKDFHEKVPVLAHKYPFELDTFQKQAVLHLERGDSVFVAAHTSAGKTVVAEYAIALCKKHFTRAIYTSPIKALSNQKFRDFKTIFQDVGLITGDIQLNNDAFCLIMTTEILRSMLYNGSDVVREVEWVIFDEVHYINDPERGVVWEEVFIMLPRHVKIIMLSATVPNCVEFADWVGRIKDRKVYVISTPKRPVPLEHFLYTGRDGKTKDDRVLLVDQNGTFLTNGFNKAMDKVNERKQKTTGPVNTKSQHVNPKTDRNIWVSLIGHLEQKDLLPMVAFTFSRKKCDGNAAMLTTIDLTTSQQKTEIHHFFARCINQLKGTDRKLPQVVQMQELCKRGLAVHHSGILPILKEAVEMLFQQGFVRVLFATETFAMGVNMPARTVVFDSMQKFDGKSNRDLNPGEYTQMAGRAGRRGKDKTGTVILLCKERIPEMSDLHKMMKGTAEALNSQFRVTYGLVLNSLRVEKIRIEEILRRSFAESHQLRNVMKLEGELVECKKKLDRAPQVNCTVCEDIVNYHETCRDVVRLSSKILQNGFFLQSNVTKQLNTPGRLVLFSEGSSRNCVGIVVRPSSLGERRALDLLVADVKPPDYMDSIGDWKREDEETLALFDLCFLRGRLARPTGDDSKHSIRTVPIERVLAYSTSKTIKIQSDTISSDWTRRQQPRFRNDPPDRSIIFALQELQRAIESGPETLEFSDLTKDAQYSTLDLQTSLIDFKRARSKLETFSCVHCLSFKEHLLAAHERYTLEARFQKLRFQSSSESLTHMKDYQDKLEVLKELGYVDENNVVKIKGKVACSMNVFELIVTELIFFNVLGPLTPAEIAAALSFTTCQGVMKLQEVDLCLPDRLNQIKNSINVVAAPIFDRHKRIADTAIEFGGEELRFELMEIVFEWAKGTPFCEIMKMTDSQEGIIVRCIQRLNEVARDVRNASRIVGDPTLQQKMEEMSALIKRDIVFAASLYTTM